MPVHNALIGANLHRPFDYQGTSDPGAVGADKWWADYSNRQIKKRNTSNTAWESFSSAPFGGEVPNAVVIEPGTSWDDTKTIIGAAESGAVVYLPNETVTMTSAILLQKPITLIGAGPNTKWLEVAQIHLFGSAHPVWVGNENGDPIDGIRFLNFAIEHDRTNYWRGGMIFCLSKLTNVEIAYMRFYYSQASCINVYGTENSNFYIHHNFMWDFWEQGVEIGGSGITNATIAYNRMTVFSNNTNIGSTKPIAIFLGMETGTTGPNEIINVSVDHNQIDFSPMDFEPSFNTMGIALQKGHNDYDWRTTGVSITHNRVMSADFGIRLFGLHQGFEDETTANSVAFNYCANCVNTPLLVQPSSQVNTTDDVLDIAFNTFRARFGGNNSTWMLNPEWGSQNLCKIRGIAYEANDAQLNYLSVDGDYHPDDPPMEPWVWQGS